MRKTEFPSGLFPLVCVSAVELQFLMYVNRLVTCQPISPNIMTHSHSSLLLPPSHHHSLFLFRWAENVLLQPKAQDNTYKKHFG